MSNALRSGAKAQAREALDHAQTSSPAEEWAAMEAIILRTESDIQPSAKGGRPKKPDLKLGWKGADTLQLSNGIPAFGLRIPAETLRRFWTMLAHEQGGVLNAARLAAGLGVSGQSIARYLDLLVDLMLVRRLPPWHANAGKRLVKSPKVYIRDPGLAHALLGLESAEQLLGHPVVGGSWEGFCIENLIAAAPRGTQASFYRSAAGAEIDLILRLPDGALWAIEVKRTTVAKVARGFHIAAEDLDVAARILVYADPREVAGQGCVRAMPLDSAVTRLAVAG